jgi:alkylation response protein AidB-like acyl-CoA dehydrogenase
MDLRLSQRQEELVAATRRYAEQTIRPQRARLEALSAVADFPFDLMREGTELGLKSLPLPGEFGGEGADMVTLCLVAEELAAGDLSVAYFFRHYWRFARLIPKLPDRIRAMVVDGIRHDERFVPASASTEPAAGSDNALPFDSPGHGAMLRAEEKDGGWLLNGHKLMITNGGIASLYFVLGRTDPAAGVSTGATMFAVPASTPGLHCGPLYCKLGQRGSPQTDVFFRDCWVEADSAITPVGHGYAATERGLVSANITNAAMCLGVARAAFESALDWSVDRVQGGRPIYQHQLVAHDLGAMRIKLQAARSFLLSVAWEYSHAPQFDAEISRAVRVFAADVALAVTQSAMFLFGGRGIMSDFPAEKYVRDALTLTHGNGTNPLMTLRVGTREAERRLAAR